ncbi:MAG: hypothetical protein ACRCYU_10690, partial [Nocardioides sp.]
MGDYRVRLEVGERILLPSGYAVVAELAAGGYTVRDVIGVEHHVPWTDLAPTAAATNGRPRHHQFALRPLLDSIDQVSLRELMDWTERIQVIVTGYANGHACLARDGEPHYPYGPTFGVSIDQRCERMAAEMTREREPDRDLVRRVERGELKSLTVSKSTVRSKLRAFEHGGVAALVDGRRIRRTDRFDRIDPVFRDQLTRVAGTLDG